MTSEGDKDDDDDDDADDDDDDDDGDDDSDDFDGDDDGDDDDDDFRDVVTINLLQLETPTPHEQPSHTEATLLVNLVFSSQFPMHPVSMG